MDSWERKGMELKKKHSRSSLIEGRPTVCVERRVPGTLSESYLQRRIQHSAVYSLAIKHKTGPTCLSATGRQLCDIFSFSISRL